MVRTGQLNEELALRGCPPTQRVGGLSAIHSPAPLQLASAFTLIELLLVMAVLTMMVALSAPTLSHFFRGRALDSEARRLVALTHIAQSRAASEGLPMDVWVDANNNTIGIEAEPSYEPNDPKADQWTIDSGLQIEVTAGTPALKNITVNPNQPVSTASVRREIHAHPNLPAIRFMPDGSISETSPQKLRLVDREGVSKWVALSADRSYYEIRNTEQ
jgi:prepilin-type N-terminal cleavage/methylation domain-containing protein